MDPFILQPCVPLYLDGEEICSPEAVSMGGSSGEWSSSIISDTPVTVYSNRSEATNAPRKDGRNKDVFMFRSQIPAPRSLRGEWTLPIEGCGKWGYVFKYELGELWLYQLNEGENLMESSNLVKLTSGDWAVLKLLVALVIGEANEDFPIPEEENVTPKRRRREEDNLPPPSPSDSAGESSAEDGENDEIEVDDPPAHTSAENDGDSTVEIEVDPPAPIAAENDEDSSDEIEVDPPLPCLPAEKTPDKYVPVEMPDSSSDEDDEDDEDDSSSDEDDNPLHIITEEEEEEEDQPLAEKLSEDEEEDAPPAPEKKEEKATPASADENKENIPPAPEKASEEEEEDIPPPPPRNGGMRFKDGELSKTKIILSTVWSSGTTATGRWRLRASLRSRDESDAPDIFVMEKFNPDCGLFRSMMVLPAKEWVVRMLQVRKDITILFQSCRCWRDAVAVKKTLSF
ncbi:arachidonate 15-lipoxygenase (second type) / 8-lipoxygenase (S-type) [Sarotherodon galilaeus]